MIILEIVCVCVCVCVSVCLTVCIQVGCCYSISIITVDVDDTHYLGGRCFCTLLSLSTSTARKLSSSSSDSLAD